MRMWMLAVWLLSGLPAWAVAAECEPTPRLAWTLNTERDLAHYVVRVATVPDMTDAVEVVIPAVPDPDAVAPYVYTVSLALEPGEVWFMVKAVDTAGQSSVWSPSVMCTMPDRPPAMPAHFRLYTE